MARRFGIGEEVAYMGRVAVVVLDAMSGPTGWRYYVQREDESCFWAYQDTLDAFESMLATEEGR